MKKIILGLMAVVISFASIAQDQTDKHEGHKKGGNKEFRHKGGRGFEGMNLTDGQKAQFKTINETYRDKMKSLSSNKSISAEAQKQQRETLRTEHKQQLMALLTPDQKKQWEEKRKQHSFKGKDGKGKKGRKQAI